MTEEQICACVQNEFEEHVTPIFNDLFARLNDIEFLKARVAHLENMEAQNENH